MKNNGAVNLSKQVILWTSIFSSFESMPSHTVAGSCVRRAQALKRRAYSYIFLLTDLKKKKKDLEHILL